MQGTDSELYQLLAYKILDPAMDDQLHNLLCPWNIVWCEKLKALAENEIRAL